MTGLGGRILCYEVKDSDGLSLLISVILSLVGQSLRAVFTYRNFDALTRKGLAERRALNDSWELFGREDLKWFGKTRSENGGAALVESIVALAAPHIDEIHL